MIRILSRALVLALALAPVGATSLAAESSSATMKAERGFFGVQLDQGDDGVVRAERLVEGAPAADAGMRVGDEIVSFQGEPVTDVKTLVKTVKGLPPGTRVDVLVRRDGAEQALTVLLGVRPGAREILRTEIVDKPARPLQATALDGGAPLDLADYRGKVVLVDFWEPWCGPCLEAMPHLSELYTANADRGLAVIGLSGDAQAKVEATLARQPVSYTIGLDTGGETNSDWLVTALPTLFLVDREGVVREMFVGAQSMDEVDAAVEALLAE